MRSRWPLVLIIVVALLAAVVLLRRGDDAGADAEADGEDSDAPIVAPSRVRSDAGETRVVLDTGEIRRIALATAVLQPAAVGTGQRLTAQVVPEPERAVTLRAPVAGRLNPIQGRRWPALGERVAAGTAIGRVSDAQPLSVPMAGVVTRVEARPGEIVEAGQVLLEIADNSRPVVRVSWPDDTTRAPRPSDAPSTGRGSDRRHPDWTGTRGRPADASAGLPLPGSGSLVGGGTRHRGHVVGGR